ncbi:MAG: alpha/beta fold hydrolase, partial [Cyanobacteria bacterium]|nr:alpha/beta fold hydrolase [Cyanobacteriota bacterium]MDW8201802.1 alpha/beta fold hydrolase [Cyanobacteriota bacterium SKYGB_h_bin112]
VVLVGNSIGSLVCMATAAAYPEIVRGVVMLNLPDSSVVDEFFPAPMRPVLRNLGRWLQPLTAAIKGILTQPVLFNPVFGFIRHPSVIRSWAQQAYADRSRVTNELVDLLSRPAYDHGASCALRAMLNSPPGKLTAKIALPKLQIPLLLIWGKQDQMVPPTLIPLFAKLNPAMTIVPLDKAGHCPHDETPERVNPLILNWIASWL